MRAKRDMVRGQNGSVGWWQVDGNSEFWRCVRKQHRNGNDRALCHRDALRRRERRAGEQKAMASQLLSNLVQAITPAPPPPLDDDYDGLEFSWKFFVFRPARESISYFHHASQINAVPVKSFELKSSKMRSSLSWPSSFTACSSGLEVGPIRPRPRAGSSLRISRVL